MCGKCESCTVPVSVLASGSNITLPDVDRLSKGTIRTILVRRSNGVTLKNINGQTLAADTVIATAHLRLTTKNGAETLVYPLSALQRDVNSPEALCVNLPEISLASSGIVLDTTASGYNAAHVIEIVFGIDCPIGIC